jgi:hypothetical protein
MSADAWVLAIVGTIGFGGYGLWLASHGLQRGRTNRSIRRHQSYGGGMYGQINSTTGRMRPVKVGWSVWFLVILCAVVVWAIWFR